MLKVVGASWYKTRISTCILLGAGLLAIGGFFIAEIERPKLTGIYCATIFWTEKTGFQVEYWKQRNDLTNIPKGVARICYKDSIAENGWSHVEIETQRNYADWVQAFGAGVLEGTLTWNNIYNQWSNTIQSPCQIDEDSKKFCSWLRSTLNDNYIRNKIIATNNSKHDHYWHHIRLFYYQLEGLEAGWRRGATRSRSGLEDEIPFVDFLLMNSVADIQDLKTYYLDHINNGNNKPSTLNNNFITGRSSMLIRLFPNATTHEWKLLMGHSAAGSYSSMLRVHKRYKFHYHFTSDDLKTDIPGSDISYTGYPGILSSTDDFFIIKGRKLNVIVAGVSIKHENVDLLNRIEIENFIPLSARIMTANRLALTRRQWEKHMSRHLSSGSKQWIQIDLKRIDYLQAELMNKTKSLLLPGQITESLIWIAEQLPGQFKALDITNEISANGSSLYLNGIPYFNDILDASGLSKENYSDNLNEMTNNMTNIELVDDYLRKNAFRGDLLGEHSLAYGNIDMKLFSYDPVVGISDFDTISGPLYIPKKSENKTESLLMENGKTELISEKKAENYAELEFISDSRPQQIRSVRNDIYAIAKRRIHQHVPFKWSAGEGDITNVRHDGHPDEWNFDKVSPNWAW